MAIDMNDPEDKAAIAKLVSEAVASEKEGLVNKNNELLGAIKDLKTQNEAAATRVGEFEAAAQTAEKSVLEKKGDYDKLLSVVESDYKKVVDGLTGQLDAERSATRKLLVSDGLSAELAHAGIAPQFVDVVKSHLIGKLDVVEDGDVRRVVGNTDNGAVSLQDFVKSYADSDAGKVFVAAANNSGGGADNKGSTGNGVKNPWMKDSYNVTEQGNVYKKDPQLAGRLQREAQDTNAA